MRLPAILPAIGATDEPPIEADWVGTAEVRDTDLTAFDGIWALPGSPYASADGMLDGGEWTTMFLTSPSMSIRGGTDEIQRNIVGERVLGLPPEPRVDADRPWNEIPH